MLYSVIMYYKIHSEKFLHFATDENSHYIEIPNFKTGYSSDESIFNLFPSRRNHSTDFPSSNTQHTYDGCA